MKTSTTTGWLVKSDAPDAVDERDVCVEALLHNPNVRRIGDDFFFKKHLAWAGTFFWGAQIMSRGHRPELLAPEHQAIVNSLRFIGWRRRRRLRDLLARRDALNLGPSS